MPKITVIAIPCDETQPIRVEEIDQGDLRKMQELVGGFIEAVDIYNPDATIFINEEGKLTGLESNRRATALLWVHESAYREHDVIQGDVFIAGQPDAEGDTQGAPQHYIDLVTKPATYTVEVQTRESDEWNASGQVFDHWLKAYVWGIAFASRWASVREIRVLAM